MRRCPAAPTFLLRPLPTTDPPERPIPERRPPRIAALVLAVLLAACGSSPTGEPDDDPDPGDDPDPREERVLFIVNHVDGMNASERAIEARVETLTGLPVDPVTDEAFVEADTVGCRMILYGKTADDAIVRDRIKAAPCGILFWEENAQTLQTLATVNSVGADLAFWHDEASRIRVRPEAPAELRAGLEGEIDFYVPLDSLVHVSYGRRDDMLGTRATIVATVDPDGHNAIYAYARGDTLADGTPAAARRLFFGLHRNTWIHLTEEGRALFDAAVLWAADPDESP